MLPFYDLRCDFSSGRTRFGDERGPSEDFASDLEFILWTGDIK
jgi:hypothetical protein